MQAARPEMERLIELSKETVNLGVIDGGEVQVIETIGSPQAVRMSSKIGNRRYLHSPALGKVFVAAVLEKDLLRLIRTRKVRRFTPRTTCTENYRKARPEQRLDQLALQNQTQR
jgi:DNA-binding IclR family transcriptional regulator